MKPLPVFLSLLLLLSNAHAQTDARRITNSTLASKPFELLDGDRVVFLGDTFIEREQTYGYIELALTVRFPDRNVTFRNLGWSADTPQGLARASFDWGKGPDEWFRQLTNQIAAVKPTVVFLGYGMANSFDGEAGLPGFKTALNKLVEAILALNQPTRFVILSPIRHEAMGAPLPDPAKHNEHLAAYTAALKEMADRRGFSFVRLFDLAPAGITTGPPRALTDNGIHLTDFGYWRVAEALDFGLGWPPDSWRVGILRDAKEREGGYGIKVLESNRTEDSVRLVALEERVARPRAPIEGTNRPYSITPPCLIQFQGLKPGSWSLKVDGETILTLDAGQWRRGVPIETGPQFRQAEELRQTIIKKNELFFHRWRPENSTYLFLFRKHEQGQNAREIPQFDPLVQAEEEKIARLRRPVKHTYELSWVGTQNTNAVAAVGASKAKATASPLPKNPATPFRPQPPPEFQLEPGLEISLFAQNPLLAKPIQISFDPQGRLWVASSSVYPQILPGQEQEDKILILEDTDGDGKADKTTVFADGLLIPTGVEPGDGGCYVGQSTELLHFKDTDGDGVADQRRVVLSGFGTEDTHHILHTLRWGHDGQLYMNQSIYIHSHIETPHGVVRLNSGGTLGLRPDTMELGVLMKGLVNGWGHDFDEFGQSFQTDGAGGQGINWNVPQAMFVTFEGARRILGSVSPGSYPKFCGLEIIKSEHFPKAWQGNAVTCDFRANRMVRFEIEEQGAAYTTRQHEFVRSTNVTFRPIDVKLGPDGALYIADWSNPIIQHGEVDFRDARRDRVHGRIWRVSYKGGVTVKKPELVQANNPELLNQLLSPNGYNERQARRVLIERGKTALDDLEKWVTRKSGKALLEALWLYQCFDVPDRALARMPSLHAVDPRVKSPADGGLTGRTSLLEAVLTATDARIRAAAVRVLGAWVGNTPGIPSLAKPRLESSVFGLLEKSISDDHPRVRLEALRALARIPGARAAELALSMLDHGPVEGHLEYALWLTINDLAAPWIAAVESGAWKIEGHEQQLQYALKAIEPKLASGVMAKVIGNKSLPRDGSGGLIELIGQAGGAAQLRQMLDQVLNGGFDETAVVRALTALSEAARIRNAKPSGDLAGATKLLESRSEKARAGAARLAGTWKLAGAAPALLKIAGNKSASSTMRQAAFEGLREIGGSEVATGLGGLAGKEHDAFTRQQSAMALAGADLNGSLPQILEVVGAISKEDDALALWRSLLSVKGSASAVARALAKLNLPEPVARAGVRVAREGGRNEPDLVLALNRAGGLSSGTQDLTDDEIHQIAYNVSRGDPARGESIYRRKELACVVCHAIGGAGGRVGPDLTSLGAASPIVDYIVEAVLLPNKKVKEGFNSVQVTTKDGEEFSGILVRETNEELILRDATNREVSVPKKNIQDRKIGGSLMPSGLLDVLSPGERLDVYRFLAELGKPGPFDASRQNFARIWRVNAALTTDGAEEVLKSDVTQWTPVYTTVSGALLKEDLQAEQSSTARREPLFAAARFQTAKAGGVTLKLNGVNSPKAWVDGKPVGGSNEITVELPAGTHTFLLKVNPPDLADQVRLETGDGTFLTD